MDPAELLRQSFQSILEEHDPARLTEAQLPERPPSLILALGKAALPMLQGAWAGFPKTPWIAVAPEGAEPPEGGTFIPGSHPLPDRKSLRAGRALLKRVQQLSPGDFVLVLLSGGGSALAVVPWGVSLSEKRRLNQALLASGAGIQEINAVRKHLSRLKGGRLAAACPAPLETLILSDVPGDDPTAIASGPTVADPTTFAMALEVLESYRILAPRARAHLEAGRRGELPETPKPGDPRLAKARFRIIGRNLDLLRSAQRFFESRGYPTLILSDRFQGEARELARFHAAMARFLAAQGQRPILLSGGEASVRLERRGGRGGRNLEFLLQLLLELPEAYALAADSDGIDGSSPAAGAWYQPGDLKQALAQGLDPKAFLKAHDAYGFFRALGRTLEPGPTGTNLNDYRALLLPHPSPSSGD
jgi:glycerate 2-kinase